MSSKQYASATEYEKKLARVMEKFGVDSYNFNYDRFGAWIEFRYKGNLYRFEHSVENAKQHGINLSYGSDCFSQLVLALEDLARMINRGIYDLQKWVAGMKFLPPVIEIPSFFKTLGFEELPESEEEIKTRYRGLAKQLHPDCGGDEEDFMKLQKASEDCIKYFKTIKNN